MLEVAGALVTRGGGGIVARIGRLNDVSGGVPGDWLGDMLSGVFGDVLSGAFDGWFGGWFGDEGQGEMVLPAWVGKPE